MLFRSDHLATDEDTAVMVTEDDFIEANRELVPSVSADELGHYEKVRATFEGVGKKEEPKPKAPLAITNGHHAPRIQPQNRGKGKAPGAPVAPQHDEVEGAQSEDEYTIRTEHLVIDEEAASSAQGKGKGKAAANNHGKGKSSVDIAEGGDRKSVV